MASIRAWQLIELTSFAPGKTKQEPVLKCYDRICFEKEALQPSDKPGISRAVLMHPGHPLMLAVSDLLLEQHANLLRQGTVLVDPADDGVDPWLMFLVTHEVKSGDKQVLSKRLQFVRVNPDGSTSFAGWAPHLDLEPYQPPLQAPIQARSASKGSSSTQPNDDEVCELNKDHPQASELFNRDQMPAFHDPFSGGGAIPLEAQRLGLESFASDLLRMEKWLVDLHSRHRASDRFCQHKRCHAGTATEIDDSGIWR